MEFLLGAGVLLLGVLVGAAITKTHIYKTNNENDKDIYHGIQ